MIRKNKTTTKGFWLTLFCLQIYPDSKSCNAANSARITALMHYIVFGVYWHNCRCAVATSAQCVRRYSHCIFDNRNVFTVHDSTSLVLRSFHDNTTMVMRNQCANSLRQCCECQQNHKESVAIHANAQQSPAKALRQHCNEFVTVVFLKWYKMVWNHFLMKQ